MAHTKDNILVKGFKGGLDERYYLRNYKGRTVLSRRPPKRGCRNRTAAEKESMSRFSRAVTYACNVLSDPRLSMAYKADAGSVYHRAISDFLRPPRILSLLTEGYRGKPGDTIRVAALDDVKVVSLRLVITNGRGEVQEEGMAVPSNNGTKWTYKVQRQRVVSPGDTITAIAEDLPGNQAVRSLTMK